MRDFTSKKNITDLVTRTTDVILSGCALILIIPFMIPVVIGLLLTGEHEVFYEQMRIGKGGKDFPLLKFATMIKNSPNLPGGLHTSKDDPRFLPMGKFLRKTKINELPQLINILKGDMSVIGYRPMVHQHHQAYNPEDIENMKKICPGLSGIGSVVFRNEEEILNSVEDKDSYYDGVIQPYKGALESWYVRNRSVKLYFELIFLTVEAVLHPKSRRWWRKYKTKGIPQPPQRLRPYL